MRPRLVTSGPPNIQRTRSDHQHLRESVLWAVAARPDPARLLAMEIEQLVISAATGDRRAWRALERYLRPKLRSWFASRFRDLDRDDLAQDTLLAIWNKLPSFEMRHEAALMAWVFKIAKFKALAALREREHRDKIEIEVEAAGKRPRTPTGLISHIYRAERIDRVRRTADEFPPSLRMAATNMLAGGDTDELAKLANIKLDSARRQENRALERLRERLRPGTPHS